MKLSKKTIKIGIAGTLVVCLIAATMFILLQKSPTATNETESKNPKTDLTIQVPSNSTDNSSKSATVENSNSKINLDVGGNTGNTSTQRANSNSKQSSTSSSQSSQKPPSTGVTTSQDATQSKAGSSSNPYPSNADNWTPPPPGTGLTHVSSGLENVPVSLDKSVDTLQTNMGLLVGSLLLKAGYNSIYPNAGSVKNMVDDAIISYAHSGYVSLNPQNYGLPALIGTYSIKIEAKGANVLEAGNYIANYIKNDSVFNDLIATKFNKYRDGFLSVYQHDGYFYVLFAVVDKGYSN